MIRRALACPKSFFGRNPTTKCTSGFVGGQVEALYWVKPPVSNLAGQWKRLLKQHVKDIQNR
jgi:hypothetical protein